MSRVAGGSHALRRGRRRSWTRTGRDAARADRHFLQDDDTICGIARAGSPDAIDRSDVLFLRSEARAGRRPRSSAPGDRSGCCRRAPAPSSRIHRRGRGASGHVSSSASMRRESLSRRPRTRGSANGPTSGCSNTTRRTRPERRATTSPASPSTPPRDLRRAGLISGPDRAGILRRVAGAVADPRGQLRGGFASDAVASAVARWSVRGKHFCGPRDSRTDHGIAPTGDAVAIDGRIYRVGLCTSDHGFEPGRETDVAAVGPGAARWISARATR